MIAKQEWSELISANFRAILMKWAKNSALHLASSIDEVTVVGSFLAAPAPATVE